MSRSPEAERTREGLEEYVASWQVIFRLMRSGRSWSGRERNQVFLNCGDGRFADVSAVTGLDFKDDGRAFSVVDWDHDGDLDLWLYNRTGPRLRLMLNQTDRRQRGASHVALRLRGSRSNTDGIGARVEVELAGRPAAKLVKTVYAGDGFQSQSSKWLHFGLGGSRDIERVTVRWPGGGEEIFAGVEANRRYLLEEGTATATALPPRTPRPELQAVRQAPLESASDARLFPPRSMPLPELPYLPFDASGRPASSPRALDTGSGPILLNLWASWCLPCLAELRELTEHRDRLDAAGLKVLALTVEGLDEKATGTDDAFRMLKILGFTGGAGVATEEMLDKLDLLETSLYELDLPFVVPLSYLIDGEGRLAAIYRGRLDLDVLLRDVEALGASAEELHRRSAPLAGRWHSAVPELDLLWAGRTFQDRYPADMERYFERAIARFDERTQQSSIAAEKASFRERAASALVDLALLARLRGDTEAAIARLQDALKRQGDLTPAHLQLGELLRDAGRHEESLQHFGWAYKADPENAVARYGLGMAFLALGDVDNALGHLSAAVHYAPDMPAPLLGMAWILIRHADPRDPRATRDALGYAQRGVDLTERQDARMLDVLAAAYARAGRFDEAIATARDALEIAQSEEAELATEIASRLAAYERGQVPGSSG